MDQKPKVSVEEKKNSQGSFMGKKMVNVRSIMNIPDNLSDKGSELVVDEKELSIMNKFASSDSSSHSSSGNSSDEQVAPRQDG